MFEFASALLAAVILLSIAFPHLTLPNAGKKKKLVGSNYWGLYKDAPPPDLHQQKIEVPKPMRKWHVVAGSSMYNNGKPTGRR